MALTPSQAFLVGLWALWCALHSLLAAQRVSDALGRRMGRGRAAYRLLYNLFAAATALPLWAAATAADSAPLFRWEGWLTAVRIALIAGAVALAAAGGRHYRWSHLSGIAQLRAGTSFPLLSETQRFTTEGVLGLMRHPWYAAAILILWAREIGTLGLAVNLLLSLYLLIGAHLEERRLLAQFGDAYQAYRSRVSMFFPWKWAARKLGRGDERR